MRSQFVQGCFFLGGLFPLTTPLGNSEQDVSGGSTRTGTYARRVFDSPLALVGKVAFCDEVSTVRTSDRWLRSSDGKVRNRLKGFDSRSARKTGFGA